MSKFTRLDRDELPAAREPQVRCDAWLAAIAAVEAEAELDGEMPDELWQALQTHTKSEMEAFLRSMVQGIKRNIRNRILAASVPSSATADEGGRNV